MLPNRNSRYLQGLAHELSDLPAESEWVEFKRDNASPETIGRNVSALANGAALNAKPSAYIVWGIEDRTRAIVGTDFAPHTTKMGNEPLENWLHSLISPQTDLRFHQVALDDRRVAILEIQPAAHQPVAFSGREYVRVGASTRSLRDYPEKERALWRIFDRTLFERDIAIERLSDEDVLSKLNYSAYFDLLNAPPPDGNAVILDALSMDDIVAPSEAGGWNITNLGAVLFAKNLNQFPRLGRKAMRVVEYEGAGRFNSLRQQTSEVGYAVGLDGIVDYIMTLAPSRHVIEGAIRRTVTKFPEIAVRELVANALIHQDFTVTGAGPLVAIFDDRIEITNPGAPLVDTNRFVDAPPKSRNEALSAHMRRFGFCEEEGTGIDKVVAEVEKAQLPAPLFEEAPGDFTRVTLYAHKPLAEMDRSERVRACYHHASLRRVNNRPVNNASIRERFGISRKNSFQASRLLREAVEAGVIVVRNPDAGRRIRSYLPYWAV